MRLLKILFLILIISLLIPGVSAEQIAKTLGQDPEYIELYDRFQKLQKQLVESEKKLGEIYSKYLGNIRRGKKHDLSKDPAYKKACERRECLSVELNGVMQEMMKKARKASGFAEDPPKSSNIPAFIPGPKAHIFIKEPEINLTYPTAKPLENQLKTE